VATYLRPQTLDEALEALRAVPRTIVAGATDHYPSRVGAAGSDEILDISAIQGLSGIAESGQSWRIGALATWSDVIAADLPPIFDGLKATGHTIGGVQIQNRGTVCGNVCNASPAADGIPSLMEFPAIMRCNHVG
jgi:CO/xanthine dehydrogenase FAD-binding subunit